MGRVKATARQRGPAAGGWSRWLGILPPVLVERLLLPVLRLGLILTRQARTLGAVGILVADGRVLLVRTWYRADWGLPGGYLRRAEEPEDGFARELREETAIELGQPVGPPICIFQPRRRHIDFVFTAQLEPAPDMPPAGTSWEITTLEWFPLDALPRLQPEAAAALEAAGFTQPSDP
jgi:8-oxo-dGTP pyrophosphatase MutT (NUDIX family)